MARTLEDLIIVKRTALRYLLARESRLLALGKRPVNKKIANFVRDHQNEENVWATFMDTLNEDLTRNIKVYSLKFDSEDCSVIKNTPKRCRLDSESRNILEHYKIVTCGGRMVDSPIATVEEGQLQGKLVHSPSGKAFYSFQGIPYAKPPIGSLRFRAPQPPEPWEGIRDATTEGNSSAQLDYLANNQYLGDENCLFLNVYTPTLDGEFLPVMVYVHGGGFRWGSSSTYYFGGDYLVEKDVVIVTINYRCGPLGFLSLNTPEVPGNAGMKDMVQALRWVKQNIQNFGGNSRNLTIFGESAGGVSVSLLTASPMSKDLISKAIIQSGTALCSWGMQNNPLENARVLASELGCESKDLHEILEYLSTTPVRDIVEAAERMNPTQAFVTGKTLFGPVVEKEFAGVEAFLTEAFISVLTSGRVADVPIMIGSNALEFTYDPLSDDLLSFVPPELNIETNTPESLAIVEGIKQLYFKEDPTVDKYKLLSDFLINIGTHRYVQYLLNVTNKPVYYYKFGYVGELNISKDIFKSVSLNYAAHFDELGYLFKNEPTKDVEPTPQDVKTRERMLRLWTNFAKTGNPTPDENHYLTVTWLPATKDKVYYMNINNELTMDTNPDKEKMEFWDNLYSKYFKIWDHQITNDDVTPISAPISPKSEPISPKSEPISPKNEPIIVATSPLIVEETIITTVTTVVNEKGEEKTSTEVLVDVQDSTGQHYQESFNDLKGNLEQNFDHVQDKLAQIPDNLTQIPDNIAQVPDNIAQVPDNIAQVQGNLKNETMFVVDNPIKPDVIITGHSVVDEFPEKLVNIVKLQEKFSNNQNGGEEHKFNGNFEKKPRPSNEIKMVQNSNINPKDVIRANDPPEDDLPKNIGVNKFVNFFESLGGKK
ncbi:esterase E4-like isoform X2 [Maniola jurtina]|uniref:esterase E4-like isoform X2 n=1 Tax=Maniola jurtina TaxID=191418 RepID=UPI001E6877A3|nr:esterase E4-like isoform X2 [Maniola jurtina]